MDDVDGFIARVRSFDPDAWEGLYRRVYPRLLAYATRRLDHDRARDAVGETMTRAVAKIDGFVPSGGGLEAWLFGICRHVVLDAQRAAGRQGYGVASDMPSNQPDAIDRIVAAEDAAAVRAAFARLDDADRELLELRVIAGLSSDEVAQVLGRRAGAIRMAQSRALGRLRQRLLEES